VFILSEYWLANEIYVNGMTGCVIVTFDTLLEFKYVAAVAKPDAVRVWDAETRSPIHIVAEYYRLYPSEDRRDYTYPTLIASPLALPAARFVIFCELSDTAAAGAVIEFNATVL